MATYKGIEVAAEIRPYLPHMPHVEEYREQLQSLQSVWDTLNLLGQLSGTTAEMGATREGFASLTGDLLSHLAQRGVLKRAQELAAKAQMSIDILVRNLFERTADIGFLATDDGIRQYLMQSPDAPDLRARFQEYVRKYSVYADIVLLDAGGRLVASFLPHQLSGPVSEPWVDEALRTSAAYVEYFGDSALFATGQRGLLYAYRVNSAAGGTLGVLALHFRFADEMERIFSRLLPARHSVVLALQDASGTVLISSDPWQLPTGACLSIATGQATSLRFAGRHYLAFSALPQAYQGYAGPGWQGLTLVAVDQAFSEASEASDPALPADLLHSLLQSERVFSPDLRAIPGKAASIQRNLGRSVWNGTVRLSAANLAVNPEFSKILLREISRTGMRMRAVFSTSIRNLQSTVISALLDDVALQATLAVDIMDRNLYERANDCRWWALDPTLIRLLAQAPSDTRQLGLTQVLETIHGLYTVYDSLVVFDARGCVQAVSGARAKAALGKGLQAPWVDACLQLRDSQAYVVSGFLPSALYAGAATYIYAAAIRGAGDGRVLGGIAIVFDSQPQFQAMLQDILPRDERGLILHGAEASFIDVAGTVIASSNPVHTVGSPLPLLAALRRGEAAEVKAVDGSVLAIGQAVSQGYREYKSAADAYRNEVTAVVSVPLGGHLNAPSDTQAHEQMSTVSSAPVAAGTRIELATFYLGGHWLGVPVSEVLEAIEPRDLVRLPNAPARVYGGMVYGRETIPLYNLHAALGLNFNDDLSTLQVVVLQGTTGQGFGILVDALGEICEVAPEEMTAVANVHIGAASVLGCVVKRSIQGGPMLVTLSLASMEQQLTT